MHFRVRWPDQSLSNCYSPSSVIKDFFEPGESYPLSDFVQRSRNALGIANERVRQKYGMPCGRAAAQLAEIEHRAERFALFADATVTIETFQE